jgi:hypothetical protein
MARSLTPTLDAAMLGQVRRPAFSIEIFDIRSTSTEVVPTRINDVVIFHVTGTTSLPTIVGPREFDDDVRSVAMIEQAGDYVEAGINTAQITFVVSDPDGQFDPVTNPPTGGDPEALGRWLRQGNVVVIREGDEAELVVNWPITFTGSIKGQPGQDFNRTTGNAQLTVKAVSREADFQKLENTSRNFLQGSTYFDIANEIAEVDMGLDLDEISFTGFGSRLTVFLSTQFVMENPLISVAKLMFPDGFMPKFEGIGTLGLTNAIVTKAPARFFPESSLPISIIRPMIEDNGVNSVEVLGLDANMDQIVQFRQELARASITTGYFAKDTEIPVSWSEDLTQQALNVQMVVLASIGDSIFSFGDESFAAVIQTDGGSVQGEISVDGALGASIGIIYLLAVLFVATAFIPDGTTGIGGPTIPIGKPLNALVGKIIQTVLGTAGRGDYRIVGQPFEYVFPEIREVARVLGLRSEDVSEITVENHLINTTADAAASALRILRRERAKVNSRTVEMIHDLRLEPDDIFAVGDGIDERRYMIQTINRTLARGGRHTAQLNCFEVTVGVRP